MIASASSTSSTGLIPVYGRPACLCWRQLWLMSQKPALLLRAEVLAEPEHGQVDQVAPLDRRRRLHHRLAVRERVPVVRRHRRQLDVGDLAALERRRPPRRRRGTGEAGFTRTETIVRRRPVGPAGERDLLRRPPRRRLAELGERLLVEREDEVRLRLDVAVEVVAERRRRRTRSRCAAGPPSAPPRAGTPG